MSYKSEVNKILERNEVKLEDLIVGQEYLLEYNIYNKNKTIKKRGVYMYKQIFRPPYVMTFFKTTTSTILTMFNETCTRYYKPVSDKIKQNSLERQAFAQSINKLIIENSKIKNIYWRAASNKNNIGNGCVKIYFTPLYI
jgi:hypothetical protein